MDQLNQNIDWQRMASPQYDGYDTAIALQMAQHSRRPTAGAVTFCEGHVAIRQAPELGLMTDRFVPAALDHPNLARAAVLLARWPAAYLQFQQLIDTVYPYTDHEQARMGPWALGSSSHSYEEDFGSIHATVDNALGLAQALIHEMSHQKLRALGIFMNKAQRLITSEPAPFHDQYSFMHVTALDLHMLPQAEDESERQSILMLLARNVPRMQAGYQQLAHTLQTDQFGKLFTDAFMVWSLAILNRGQSELDANGYGGFDVLKTSVHVPPPQGTCPSELAGA